jgi:hypothetical protein
MARPKKYPDELIQRGVRLALEGERPIAHTNLLLDCDFASMIASVREPARTRTSASGIDVANGLGRGASAFA